MTKRKTTYRWLVAAALIGIPSIGAQRELAAQRPEADVRIIRTVDVSSDTLQVIAEYTYRGELPAGGVRLHATPAEAGGVFDPRTVKFEELPVRAGFFTIPLTITKRPDARDFTSVAVRVCLSTADYALVCRDLPYRKQWTTTAPTTPPPVPAPPEPHTPPPTPLPPVPEPTPETCSITGSVTGPLEGISAADHPGGVSSRVRLRYIVARSTSTTLRAEVQNRRFVFKRLQAGVAYQLSPIGFWSNPRTATVQCKAGVRHFVTFHIKGALGEG